MDYSKTFLVVVLSAVIYDTAGFILDTTPATVVTHHYSWASWGRWSECHVDCAQLATHHYTQTRTRDCKDNGAVVTYTHCGSSTRHHQTRDCNIDCPVWSTWSKWSNCSASCGGGTGIRVRHCGTGQTTCPGHAFETHSCGTQACPVDGAWGMWAAWGGCTATCGTATKTRHRLCNSPAPANGGATCPQAAAETVSCNQSICVIDGGWTDWSGWNQCDVTCGNGSETRIRTCSNPPPRNGGKLCSGSSVDVRACTKQGCPIDGGWSAFTTRPCSVSCGNGVTVKYRTCNNPAPANGGRDCDGSATEFAVCKLPVCVIDGGWSEWSNWTDCGVVCGAGKQWRTRTCDNPVPQHGGASCTGQPLGSNECNNGACPPDIKQCRDSDIDDLVQATPFVVADPDARPQVCNTSDSLQAELLIKKHCQVSSTELDWELGIQILGNCDKIPLYAPIGLIDKQTSRRKYGILLGCYSETIQLADLSCNDVIEVQTFPLNHLETDYHIMLL